MAWTDDLYIATDSAAVNGMKTSGSTNLPMRWLAFTRSADAGSCNRARSRIHLHAGLREFSFLTA